jgi:gliding motility associated protien GldN
MKTIGKLFICTLVFVGFGLQYVQAQAISMVEKREVYDKEHIPKKDPIPYPYVREANVMYEKVIWRMVNLREKMNHPLYFPTAPIGDRRSVTQLLLDVLEDPLPGHQVFAYKFNPGRYEFEQPMSLEDIHQGLKIEYIPGPVFDSVLQMEVMDTIAVEIDLTDVTRLLIKEKWYFDNKYSSFQVRIIGIAPIRVYPRIMVDQTTGEEVPTGEILRNPLFWVYYPEVRYYFSHQESYNPANDAQQISFDDVFSQRRFSSYIFRESNVYDNRNIDMYAKGMDAMFEAENIKNSLMEWEHDLWEY